VRSCAAGDEVAAAAADMPTGTPDVFEICQPGGAELISVIMAAVAEFEGAEEFAVLTIKSSGCNWTLSGWQDLIRDRL
jgi:hypothetical protein